MSMKILFLVVFLLVPFVTAQLREGFYSTTCPRAEQIVRQVVQNRFNTDQSITAALLRMHFHDCFVRGCDASILIDSTQTKPSEKLAGPNLSVRGYDLIDDIKKALEAACQSRVSCADIITLATRDAVALAGGPAYNVPTGRRDGLVSDPNQVNLPGPTASVSQALQFFSAKNLTLNDMVALLGAHTVGVAHCGFFQDRLTNFQGTNKPDSTMDPILVSKLSMLCGTLSRPLSSDPTTFLDQNTSFVVDNEFYNQIRSRKGVMRIDQELANDKSTAPLVARFASNSVAFRQTFANAMVKMANTEVLVGMAGEIRNNCRAFNSPTNGKPNGNGSGKSKGNDKGNGKGKGNDIGNGKGKGNDKGKGKGKGGGKGKGKGKGMGKVGGKGKSKTIKN